MEIEQISKQVEWLDEERRKDKNLLIAFEERLVAMEGNVKTVMTQLKDLTGEITRLSILVNRMDQMDEQMLKHKMDVKQSLDGMDKEIKKREEDAEKLRRVEMKGVDTSINEIKKEANSIAELKRGLQARVDEEVRVVRTVDEMVEKVEEIKRNEEEFTRIYRLLEDGRRQDVKRLTDLQGDMASIRKRTDEHRGELELASTNTRKVETRMNEWEATENERRKSQNSFLENQTLIQAERERVWREWQTRFEQVEKHAEDIESYIQSVDETNRTVKRSQQDLEELAEKVERRVGEMSEIQRLAEERFRQEWVTFKADDQKRWTNYTLTQEEQLGESGRHLEKLTDRVTHLDDSTQELQDLVNLINEQSEKQLQSMLTLVHEWVSTFERSFSRTR